MSGDLGDYVGETLRPVVQYLPLFSHYTDMVRGIIDTKDLVYLLSVIVLFLFLSTRMVETRRWK